MLHYGVHKTTYLRVTDESYRVNLPFSTVSVNQNCSTVYQEPKRNTIPTLADIGLNYKAILRRLLLGGLPLSLFL